MHVVGEHEIVSFLNTGYNWSIYSAYGIHEKATYVLEDSMIKPFVILFFYNNSQIWVHVPMKSNDCSDYTDCVKDEEQVIYQTV